MPRLKATKHALTKHASVKGQGFKARLNLSNWSSVSPQVFISLFVCCSQGVFASPRTLTSVSSAQRVFSSLYDSSTFSHRRYVRHLLSPVIQTDQAVFYLRMLSLCYIDVYMDFFTLCFSKRGDLN